MKPLPQSRRLYPESNIHAFAGFLHYVRSGRKLPRLRNLSAARDSNYKPWLINQFLDVSLVSHRYLEIGLRKGKTFEKVRARKRVGIDPDPQFNLDWLPRGIRVFRGTSDEYFKEHPAEADFDAIFIDGLHTYEQVTRDILNSFDRIAPNGVIIIDDCWPRNEAGANPQGKAETLPSIVGGESESGWWGDVWKIMPWLTSEMGIQGIHLIGERGSAVLVVWAKPSKKIKEKLKAITANFENIAPSSLFRGDFLECQISTTDLDSALAQYRQFIARNREIDTGDSASFVQS